MRYFKTNKDSILAQHLLSFTDSEESMKWRRQRIRGWVSLGTLRQYFADEELRKRYPKAKIESVLAALVKAGLLKEYEPAQASA